MINGERINDPSTSLEMNKQSSVSGLLDIIGEIGIGQATNTSEEEFLIDSIHSELQPICDRMDSLFNEGVSEASDPRIQELIDERLKIEPENIKKLNSIIGESLDINSKPRQKRFERLCNWKEKYGEILEL